MESQSDLLTTISFWIFSKLQVYKSGIEAFINCLYEKPVQSFNHNIISLKRSRFRPILLGEAYFLLPSSHRGGFGFGSAD
jgi:hypothetical protein